MSKFKLLQRAKTKFQIVNQSGDIVGSVCVPEDEISDLLRHWAGDKQVSPSPAPRMSVRTRVPTMKLGKPKPMTRAAILRGCL